MWPASCGRTASVRAEFALKADQEVVTEQRLKGSCPFLFAWNGKRHGVREGHRALGIGDRAAHQYAGHGPASPQPKSGTRFGRDQLVAHDGYYDLRITGELWETYYYDYLALMTVDHPAGTEIFTDERFVVPPVKLGSHRGRDSASDRARDRRQRPRCNGHRPRRSTAGISTPSGAANIRASRAITTSKSISAMTSPRPARSISSRKGWLHPSDSSINVAISQGHHEQPQPSEPRSARRPRRMGSRATQSRLSRRDARKPASSISQTSFARALRTKLRLRTNLEIYWDPIEWAQGLPDTPLKITRLAPATADLHYRGYSAIHQANASSPEIPDYNHLAGTTQIWRDLDGYYTRYGDVRELLTRIDDRYVIMNAGDEIVLRFPAPPPPPSGWVRDYVIAGDGWIKDGDYNSTYSADRSPLPYHAKTRYDTPPGTLEDEWVYRHHPEDWQNYQTRYVTPEAFQNALRSKARSQ